MKVSRSALLSYSAKQMFDIVADIEAYPSFLNWCKRVEILTEQGEEVIAKMHVSYRKLNIQFTTRNQNKADESIILALVDGPFSKLVGHWQFRALNRQACKVSIDMDFNFDRSLVPSIFGNMFENIISMQLDAFQNRAEQLYPKD